MDHSALGRPLRIAIVTENFLPKCDGVTRTLARLLSYLRQNGHEALVLGPESNMSSYEQHEVCGTKGIPLYFYPGLSLNFFRPRFLRKLQEFEPDVIHYVDPIWLCAQAQPIIEYALPDVVAVSSYHTNLARYASVYGYSWLVSTMWNLQRRLHGRCLATFCPSPSTQSMLYANGFDNVRLWPRGIQADLFNPAQRSEELRRTQWNVSSEQIVISYVGRISHEKNIGLLIEAFRGLASTAHLLDPGFPGCKLVLVGDGPARAELEREADREGLDIQFLGYKSGVELAEAYASSDLFAFPSHSETFGNVVLEALASGLPVVGLHAEGVCDLIQHGTTGLLLDIASLPGAELDVTDNRNRVPVNAQALVNKDSPTFSLAVNQYRQLLLTLVLDEAKRQEMGRRAVEYARTRTWEEAMGCPMTGYREAALLTHQNKSNKLLRTLSRCSSTSTLSRKSSLIDVRIEEPPEQSDDDETPSATTSARLLFGRPPLKHLLRRSTRTALRNSISLKWQTLQTVEVLDTAKASPILPWQIVIYTVLLILALVLIVEPNAVPYLHQFVNSSLSV